MIQTNFVNMNANAIYRADELFCEIFVSVGYQNSSKAQSGSALIKENVSALKKMEYVRRPEEN